MAYVIFLSIVAALGGFLFGYDTAVISGTIGQVTGQFGLNEVQQGWYVSCALTGSIAGVAVAGWLSDRFGRRPVLFLAAAMFTLSAAGCMLSAGQAQLVVYRIIGGVGIGVASIISPLYISEIAVTKYRGTLVALYQLAITVGFLGAYLVNYAILNHATAVADTATGSLWDTIFISENWRGMLGMETLPALLFLGMIFFIPESPRWLVIRERYAAAGRIMARSYGPAEADRQMDELKSLIAAEAASGELKGLDALKKLFGHGFRRPVLIGVALAMLGQFMGVNAVLYYGPSIFEQTGLSAGDSLLYQVIVGMINVAGTIAGMWLIDRIGRKQLVYWGVSGIFVTLVMIGAYFTAGVWPPMLLLILILLYIFSCAVSICVVIFVLLSEMYPAFIRGAAMSMAGFSLWIGTWLIGQLTPWLMSHLEARVYWLFALMCIPYMLIVWKLLPEMKGKSLEDIERGWKG